MTKKQIHLFIRGKVQGVFFRQAIKVIAKKNNIIAGIHNMKAEYAQKMINKGFQLVTVGSDQRFMSGGAKEAISKFKKIDKKESKGY